MIRVSSALLALLLFAPACRLEASLDPGDDGGALGVGAAADGTGGSGGGCAGGVYAQASPTVVECGSGGLCDTDTDCAALPGNYCQAASCAFEGCLRGWCTPTRVMGEPCDRDAECASGPCQAGADGGGAVCTASDGGTWWGPFP